MKKKLFLFILYIGSLQAKNSQLQELKKNQENNLVKKNLKGVAEKKQLQKTMLITSTEKTMLPVTPKKDVPEKKNKGVVQKPRLIAINNNITEETITYRKHWAKPFPSDFKAAVNGQEYLTLKDGKLHVHENKFSAIKNKVKITYQWALKKFGKLWHTEQKEIEFEVPEKQNEFNIKFCWDDDNRITLDNAKMVMCANIEPSSSI